MSDDPVTRADRVRRLAELRAEVAELEEQTARPTRLAIVGDADDEASMSAAAEGLATAGYEVVVTLVKDFPTAQAYLRAAVTDVVACDGVAFLREWMRAPEGRLLVKLARDVQLPTAYVERWLDEASRQGEARDGNSTEG